MRYFIYRYHPTSIGIKPSDDLTIICPKSLKNKYIELMFLEKNISTVESFELADLLIFFDNKDNISDIFTLDEGLITTVGILKSILTCDRNAWKINLAYKDKKVMRQQLEGKVVQPKLLDSNSILPEAFMIKPRRESSGKGILKTSKVPVYYTNKDYILETVEIFDTMFTCDGIAVDGQIVYFFTHEYIGNILDIKNNYYNIIRTNSKYNNDNGLINRLKEKTQIILSNLGTEDVQPFHTEFFYQSTTNRLSFCEIGKRFGGGNIPLLIKKAFHFDVLETYWQLKNNKHYIPEYTSKPLRYASTLAIFQNGKHQSPPAISVEFDYFREYPEKQEIKATSLDDLRYLVSFSVDSEKELQHIFDELKEYLYEQRN